MTVLQILCMTQIHIQMRSMEEKLPCNSRPIVGIVIVGEHKTKERNRLPYNILKSFIFPSSQGSMGSISSADEMPEQGCRCQDND